MAAGAWNMYTNGVLQITDKGMNLGSDAFNIILMTNSYTPNPAASGDTTYTSILANEVANGLGYTTKGVFVTGLSNSATSQTVTFTSSAVSWTTFTATLRYAVLVHNAAGGNAAGLTGTDLLVCYSDLTGSGSITGGGGTFTITMNASGIFAVTHSP